MSTPKGLASHWSPFVFVIENAPAKAGAFMHGVWSYRTLMRKAVPVLDLTK